MNIRNLEEAYATLLEQRAGIDRSACPAPENLLALVEGKVAQEKQLQLLDHVSGCAGCLEEFKLLQALREARDRLN